MSKVRLSFIGLSLLGFMVQVVSASKAEIEKASKDLGVGAYDIVVAILSNLGPYLAAIGLVVYAVLAWTYKKKGDEDEEKENPYIRKAKYLILGMIALGLIGSILKFFQAIAAGT